MHRLEPTPLLTPTEERELARAIEAGVLAAHLLTTGERPVPATTDELRLLADAGGRAWRRFLLANQRLVWKLAGQEARRTGLPMDELFQEGFVALAGALLRFDAERGRFTTFAMIRIRQHLAEVGAARLGDLALPATRALRMRRARGLEAVLGQERGGPVAMAEVAAELGQPAEVARRLLSHRAPLPLDPLVDGPGIAEEDPVDHEGAIYAAQFRRLLGRLDAEQARVVGLRYGFVTGEPVDPGSIAELMGVSLSTVRRLERRALATLRPLAAGFDPRQDETLAG